MKYLIIGGIVFVVILIFGYCMTAFRRRNPTPKSSSSSIRSASSSSSVSDTDYGEEPCYSCDDCGPCCMGMGH